MPHTYSAILSECIVCLPSSTFPLRCSRAKPSTKRSLRRRPRKGCPRFPHPPRCPNVKKAPKSPESLTETIEQLNVTSPGLYRFTATPPPFSPRNCQLAPFSIAKGQPGKFGWSFPQTCHDWTELADELAGGPRKRSSGPLLLPGLFCFCSHERPLGDPGCAQVPPPTPQLFKRNSSISLWPFRRNGRCISPVVIRQQQ